MIALAAILASCQLPLMQMKVFDGTFTRSCNAARNADFNLRNKESLRIDIQYQ